MLALVPQATKGELPSAEKAYRVYVESNFGGRELAQWFRAEVSENHHSHTLWQKHLGEVTDDYLIGHEANRMEILAKEMRKFRREAVAIPAVA